VFTPWAFRVASIRWIIVSPATFGVSGGRTTNSPSPPGASRAALATAFRASCLAITAAVVWYRLRSDSHELRICPPDPVRAWATTRALPALPRETVSTASLTRVRGA